MTKFKKSYLLLTLLLMVFAFALVFIDPLRNPIRIKEEAVISEDGTVLSPIKNGVLQPIDDPYDISEENIANNLTLSEEEIKAIQQEIEDNPALYDENYGSPQEFDYPFIVCVYEMRNLGETSISTYACNSLEPYLNRYLSYYLDIPEDEFLVATVREHSFVNDTNFPYFYVDLEYDGSIIPIKCTFNNSTQRYIFKSTIEN